MLKRNSSFYWFFVELKEINDLLTLAVVYLVMVSMVGLHHVKLFYLVITDCLYYSLSFSNSTVNVYFLEITLLSSCRPILCN